MRRKYGIKELRGSLTVISCRSTVSCFQYRVTGYSLPRSSVPRYSLLYMTITEINEKIKAGVVFEGASIKPKWFLWNNRKYDVKQVNYHWKSAEGSAVILHFSVTDGVNVYELSFNQKTLDWILEKIAVE